MVCLDHVHQCHSILLVISEPIVGIVLKLMVVVHLYELLHGGEVRKVVGCGTLHLFADWLLEGLGLLYEEVKELMQVFLLFSLPFF